MEHRGHTAGLEHDPPTGRRPRQRGFDTERRRRCLRLVDDYTISVPDAYTVFLLSKRPVQQNTPWLVSSFDDRTDPTGLRRRAAVHYPMKNSVFAEVQKFSGAPMRSRAGDVGDHIDFRNFSGLPSYRFCGSVDGVTCLTRREREIFGSARLSSFSTVLCQKRSRMLWPRPRNLWARLGLALRHWAAAAE